MCTWSLGVHFTYDEGLWKKLNFDEILTSIKKKLHLWNWRNLTILGRIQLVKTFVIPIFMYRAGLVSVHKDIIKEANKLIFQFIWKVQDKVKRSTLISDQESGGLTAPHLESIIQPRSRGFSLEGGRGGKRPWHRLVTCPSYTLKSWV